MIDINAIEFLCSLMLDFDHETIDNILQTINYVIKYSNTKSKEIHERIRKCGG